MFDFSRKKQFEFGLIAPDDDLDIEIHRLRKESRQGLYSEGLKLVRDVILVLTIFLLIGVFVAQPVVVEGTSMLPVLQDGERLLVNKLVYYKFESVSWGHIERGDVVVFWYPKEPDKSYVKRVIGLPGETVEVRNGIVYINGERLYESYLSSDHNQNLGSFPAKKVDEHYYFVMGDNRDNSSDSRYWGLVPEKYIYGKAFFRYWQPSNIGFIEKGHYELNERKTKDALASSETGGER
jgi:signal peptidase I, bacterial type